MQKSREWVGGCFTSPFHITDRAEPYRPTFVAWIEAPDGFVVGHDVPLPEEEQGALGRALAEAMQHPLVGPARRPSAIRVADADLAAEGKAVVGDLIPVTVAATPELDQLADVMFESMVTGAGPNTEDPQGGPLVRLQRRSKTRSGRGFRLLDGATAFTGFLCDCGRSATVSPEKRRHV